MALFSFYGLCRELQSWLADQTALFQTLQPQADNLDVMQLKYEVFVPLEPRRVLAAWPHLFLSCSLHHLLLLSCVPVLCGRCYWLGGGTEGDGP